MKKEINLKTTEEIFQAYFDAVAEHSRGDEDLIKTRFSSLDMIIRGMKKGELVLVFGDAAMGKTAFILQLAVNLFAKSGKSVLLFSPENSSYDTARRMITADSGIRCRELYKGDLNESEWLDFTASCSSLSKTDIMISDASYLPLDRLAATVEKAIKSGKADVILIDSLNFTGYNESTAQKVMALKNIACMYNVPVVCTCKAPHTLSESNKAAFIRRTGEHADVVMKIQRELYEDFEKSRETYFYILKNNKGQTGAVIMKLDLDRLVFTEQDEY